MRKLISIFILLFAYPAFADYVSTVVADGPKGYWRLNEANGNFADSSGNAHTATPNSTVVYSQTALINNPADTSITGTIDVMGAQCPTIQVASSTDFDITSNLTMELWEKAGGFDHGWFSRYSGGSAFYWIQTSSGVPRMELRMAGNTVSGCGGADSGLPSVNDNVIHHIIGTYDGANMKLYIDGVLQITCAQTGNLYDSSGGLITIDSIGCGASDPFQSTEGEVAIYNTALTAAQVLNHYNIGLSIATPTSTNTPASNTNTPTKTATTTYTFTPTITNTPTRTNTGSTSTPTRTFTNTATPAATPTNVGGFPCNLGDGHPKMCYQGTQQGKLCTVDGDCAGSGTCHIGGNINNEEQCHAELSVPLGGLPGDTIADEVVGLCSTESNLHATQNGTFVSNWYGVGFVSTLAYDYVNDQLFEGNSSVVHGWTNTNYHTIQGPSTVAVGQSDLYSEGWSRLTGDQSTGIWNSGTLTNYVFTAQVNGIAFGPSGDMWVSDYSRVMKFDPPITTGKAASLVLCSTSFGPLVVNPGNSGKCSPTGVAVDSSGQVAVADGSRILLYQTPPIVNGQFADKVLGQTDFSSNACNRGSSIGQNTLCTVSSLAFDSNGNLYVADSGNNRVLIYQKGSGFINGQNAAMVLGQTNFTSSVVGLTQSQVNTVVAVTVDNSGNVAVVDRINRRILTYDNPLGSLPSITISATHVVGQANFTSNIEGEGTSNMAFPSGVAIKSSASAPGLILFITEGNLNGSRILEYTWPIATNGPAAMVVLGQPDFLTRFRSMATTNSFEIAGGAGGIAFTSTGGVWLADTGHNRILGWADKNAAHSGANADYVLGQAHSAQGTAESANEQRANRGLLTPSSTSLFLPEQMSIDASDNLYVADNRNDRVIMYPNPAEGTAATKVFGQTSLTAHTLSFPPTATSLFNPTLAYIDSDGALWIADTGASRVTYYPTPQSSSTATIVIGQSNLNAGGNGCSSPTATNLCNPYGIYHDIPNKRLFISDEQSAGTGRILVYNYSSLASGMSASFALGVPSGANNLTSFSTCPKTQSEGCGNGSLDIHPISGNLFVVASPGVIEYPAPFSAGSLPSRLFGSNTPTSWGLQGLGGGYINCQWNTGNGDQLKFAPDKHMWVFDNGSFQVSRVLIVLDPDITAPTPTNTPSVATPTPTKTATATVTWTQQPTNTPQTPSATPTGPIPTATITFTPINTAIPTPTPTIPACILPPTATPIKAVCIPTQTP